MNVVFEKGATLELFCKLNNEFQEEGCFEVGENGFKFSGVDKDQISFMSFSVPKTNLKACDSSKESFGIDFENAKKFFSGKEFREAEVVLTDSGKEIVAEVRGKLNQHFSVPIIEVYKIDYPEPNIKYNAFLDVEPKAFLSALMQCKTISNHVYFLIGSKGLEMHANSGDSIKNFVFSKASENVADIEVHKASVVSFSTDYLIKFFRNLVSADWVEIHLKDDCALLARASVFGAEIKFYLAPRIGKEIDDMRKSFLASEKKKPKNVVRKKEVKESRPLTKTTKKALKKVGEKLEVSLSLNPELSKYIEFNANEKELSNEKFISDCLETDKLFNETDGDFRKKATGWLKRYNKFHSKKRKDPDWFNAKQMLFEARKLLSEFEN